ncbi:hypothetical protein I6G66_06415 [Delftia acidovorans]|uniref:Transmembrane protein n=1 Tax=Delftia acidovorans TaxID=80866 RepID=A0A7T2S665_DELAC|nr:hypothetical protein [Delftia acidovorans]QPS09651.1 hypothetical protein I6G66_06415 [Delftia acidovorans]
MKVVALLIALALVLTGAWYGRNVPFSKQWPLFEALRTTAAIIFAVVGAWLAIIYPERLKLSYKARGKTSGNDDDKSSELFTPAVNSTYILCIVLALGVIAPLIQSVGLWGNILYWRGASYGLLVALTIWQLWTVLLTLDPADRIKSFMEKEQRHKNNVNALMGTDKQ